MGVVKQILRAGTGPKPVKGQNVTVHCTGYGIFFFLLSMFSVVFSFSLLAPFKVYESVALKYYFQIR